MRDTKKNDRVALTFSFAA
jgi:hypothetical protein